MLTPRTLPRQSLRRAVLVVALLLGGSITGAATSRPALATSDAGITPRHAVVMLLPTDRAIMLLESRDAANAGLSFVLAQNVDAGAPAAYLDPETPVNLCIACDGLA